MRLEPLISPILWATKLRHMEKGVKNVCKAMGARMQMSSKSRLQAWVF